MKISRHKFISLLKNRISDVILIIGVFLVFIFAGGKSDDSSHQIKSSVGVTDQPTQEQLPTQNNPASLDQQVPESQNLPNQVTENNFPANNLPQNGNASTQEVPGPPQNGTSRNVPVPLSQVYPNIKPSENSNSLSDTLKNLKSSQSSTTEDLVDRNAYFQKLSEQLNKLQGSASTDSSGQAAPESDTSEEDQSNDSSIPVDEVEDYSDETPAGAPQDGNPYSDLNNIPPPKIVE